MSAYILVTGGAGFIGSHLIDRLLSNNRKVICVDNLNDFYNPGIKKLNQEQHFNYKRFEFHQGDIRDADFINKLFQQYEFGTIVHLAAMAGVRPSIENPMIYTDINVTGTQILLETAVKYQVKHFLFASSSSVYGNNEKTPFSEEDRVDFPLSPYGATKKMGELLCYTYHHLYQLPVSCLRFFTVYGPRQRPEMAIHKFVRMILNKEPIPFFGDGDTARDYTFVSDIVNGIIATMDQTNDFIIYNLGNSDPIKLSELVQTIGEICGKTPILDQQDMPAGDVIQTYANIERARKRLGYEPITDIKTGLREFIKWYLEISQKHKKLYEIQTT
ncbi:MAG: SDR family NAD(P)-dependent oxidoreductase [Candidatus Marinimicrobia bacterium]|nr:SDR family NAD(P)-dependent oxidoreductase [Candidatus Neomarinimicrobiota bacterium]